jgi:bifunctional UDP-N-acetylglucosamine pyrophosphorylase / glucosamine-1-phosphate N-acetyltransferase
MALNIIILAAGRGKRMRSALPKVLHPLAGRPLLEWIVRAVQPLSPVAIYVVYCHEGEQVRARLEHLNLQWVEQAEQNGTGHAVAQVLPYLSPDDDVLILPGDTPLISTDTLQQLLIATPHQGLGLLTAYLRDPSGLGRIVRDAEGQVCGIVEDVDATHEQLGIHEINTAILTTAVSRLQQWIPHIGNHNNQKEYYLPSIVPMAVEENCPVISVTTSCEEEVQGINDRDQLAYLERYYQRTTAKKLMLSGVTLADPERLDVRGELHAEQDVEIDINVILEGEVTIGSGSRIGANSIIRNSRIGKNVEIRPHSMIDGAVIGDSCIIGPFARIRPETQLAEGVHIGNFVETKKAKLGKGSKANHLSYLGDADIGSAVNIGAGTITCNYDGVNKHKTVIGDDAFIGSNTALIAPVSIGAKTTIGAGATITKPVPDNALALSRSEQKTIQNWKRRGK